MIRAPSRLFIVAALLSAVACDEERITLDSGDLSSLDVTVYVDANGSGTFDDGDQAVGGATVTAAGPVEVTATTGSDGVAMLEGLIPGSYALALSGTLPTGAVLATATTPVIVAPFQGAALAAEFRFSLEPGSISGRLFRDDDDDGVFDPEIDLPAAGIPVTAVRASDDATFETVTGADGAFQFLGLRPGTYTVSFGLPDDAELVGGETMTVEVGSDVTATLDAIFTGDLLIDIAQARLAPAGQTVTVEGKITWQKSWDTRAYWVEDETGGIAVFDFDRPDVALGDRVRITGTRGGFRGEVQISPVSAFENLGGFGVPVPVRVTGADVNSGDVAGELVSIDGTVASIEIQSFGTQLVTLTDEAGTEFDVYADNRTGLTESDWTVGALYGVTGVVGADDRGDPVHRVQPRTTDDVVRGGATTSIADARGAVGSTVVVQGVLTWVPSFDSRALFLQDETGGITVFSSGLPDDLVRGDLVRMIATVSTFRGETQLGSVEEITVLGRVAVPNPAGTTAARINAGEDQGELVTLTGTVTALDVLSFGNQMVTLTDDVGGTFTVYVDSRTGVTSDQWTVGNRYRVTGVLATDDRNDLPHRLEVRGDEDVVEVAAGFMSIAEARAAEQDAPVMVRGVVSRQIGWSGGRTAFIQDETGGVALFQSGLPALTPGDVVTVTGERGAFSGEVQIDVETLTVESPGTAPEPLDVTGGQINANLFQGELVRYSGTITAVEPSGTFGSAVLTVTGDDGVGVLVFVDNRSGLDVDDFSAGQTVTIVGPLGFHTSNDPGPQIEVITAADVTFGS